MQPSPAALLLCLAIAAAASCERPDREHVAGDEAPSGSLPSGGGGVIDSARTLDESLRRFREGLPVVTELQDASSSREALVRRFVRALERRDTAAFRSMVMTRAEFAHLYYPSSPYTRPPTRQAADLAWFLHIQNSQKGLSRILDRFGGRALTIRNHGCGPARSEGENTLWYDCVLHAGAGGDSTTLRLFGGVIERGGRAKLFSYANDL